MLIDALPSSLRRSMPLPFLTNDQCLELFEARWAGDQNARQALIDGNLPWVRRLIDEMSHQSEIPLPQLLEAANEGMIRAVDNFSNPELSFAPTESLDSGYAIWWVRLALAKLAQQHGWSYSVTRNAIVPLSDD